jgi:hypothetical protein
VRIASADDDAPPDLEERRGALTVVDDADHLTLAVDVAEAEAQAVRRMRVTRGRPDDRPDDRELARMGAELARRQGGRRVPRDGGIEQEHGEHAGHGEGNDEPRRTARGHARKLS